MFAPSASPEPIWSQQTLPSILLSSGDTNPGTTLLRTRLQCLTGIPYFVRHQSTDSLWNLIIIALNWAWLVVNQRPKPYASSARLDSSQGSNHNLVQKLCSLAYNSLQTLDRVRSCWAYLFIGSQHPVGRSTCIDAVCREAMHTCASKLAVKCVSC